MEGQQRKGKITAKIDAFANVAFWQFMVFLFLLCFVWVNEVMDFAAIVFDTPVDEFNLYRGFILSAAVITGGVIAVGNTYEKQRKLVKSLLMSCAYCHRVKTDDGGWMHVEDFFLSHYPVGMDKGVCSDCETMLKSVGEKGLDKA